MRVGSVANFDVDLVLEQLLFAVGAIEPCPRHLERYAGFDLADANDHGDLFITRRELERRINGNTILTDRRLRVLFPSCQAVFGC